MGDQSWTNIRSTLFIYLLKSTYETNKANDITVGQKGT